MIQLKSLLEEQIERKYLMPPSGDIFQVRDHISWAIHGILSKKYKNYSREHIADVVDDIYDDLEMLGYKIIIFSPDDVIYIRGEYAIPNLTPLQRRRIEELVLQLSEEGTHYAIQLEDDGGHRETVWMHPTYTT